MNEMRKLGPPVPSHDLNTTWNIPNKFRKSGQTHYRYHHHQQQEMQIFSQYAEVVTKHLLGIKSVVL